MRITGVFVLAVVTAGIALSLAGPLRAQTPTLLHNFKFDGSLTSEVSSVVANPLSSSTSAGTVDGISGGAAYFNGTDGMLLLEGNSVLPAGAFTLSFWKKAEVPTAGGVQQGYYACDAAGNPLDNLYLRRWPQTTPAGDPVSTPNGKIANNKFSEFVTPAVSTDAWHQHTISYTGSGQGYWYVDGQLATLTGPGATFAGLTTVKETAPGAYVHEGLALGNRLDAQRPFQGYMDEWQIYQGSAHGGMAEYLFDNPGATLDTFNVSAYPDPGLPNAPGARPVGAAIRRWKFDGNLNETNGTAHGTALGNATAGTDNGAYAGSGAVSFDGNNDAVSIASEILPPGSFTLSLWTKDAQNTQGYLFSDSANVTNLLYRRFNEEYSIWLNESSPTNFVDPQTGEPATFDEWHQITMAVDNEWGMTNIYVDGKLAKTVSYAYGWDGFGGLLSDFFLGNRADMGRDYAGLIDDLQIYNWAVSQQDAEFLFNNPGDTIMDAVPEPCVLTLLVGGLFVVFASRRRRYKL